MGELQEKDEADFASSSGEISIKLGVQSCEARFSVKAFIVASGQFPDWVDDNGRVFSIRNSEIFLELNPKKALIKGVLGPCFRAAWSLLEAPEASHNNEKNISTAYSNRNSVIDERKVLNTFSGAASSHRQPPIKSPRPTITQPQPSDFQMEESDRLRKSSHDSLRGQKAQRRPQRYRSHSLDRSDGQSCRSSDSNWSDRYRRHNRHRHHHHEHRRHRKRSLSNSSHTLDKVVKECEHSVPSQAHNEGMDPRINETQHRPNVSDLFLPTSASTSTICYDSLGPLPFGWRPVFSVEYQQTYYVYRHPLTGIETTTWERPELPPIPH
ncbi:unnamed protein product [Phytomonas sp. Hart1]|nr:unnamed protein product [Phytomonas sp. Hart1]|eukprot:CCW66197.1 unnamed protein product [Phytomonas sp. isolate Hart1]